MSWKNRIIGFYTDDKGRKRPITRSKIVYQDSDWIKTEVDDGFIIYTRNPGKWSESYHSIIEVRPYKINDNIRWEVVLGWYKQDSDTIYVVIDTRFDNRNDALRYAEYLASHYNPAEVYSMAKKIWGKEID